MTLHLAYLSPQLVCCIGDRLLTIEKSKRREPWDALANKSILITSRSARYVVSYSGAALIDGMQTDEWLVSKILGEDFDLRRGMRSGGNNTVDLFHVFDRVRSAVAQDFDSRPKRTVEGRLLVLFAGWHWNRRSNKQGRLARPFWLKIEHLGIKGSPVQITGDLKRKWWAPQPAQVVNIGADINSQTSDMISWLNATSTNPNDDQIEAHLTRNIRTIASNSAAGVGKDLISVMMSGDGGVRLRFLRNTADKDQLTAYTPFIINKHCVATPLAIGGLPPMLCGVQVEVVPPFAPARFASAGSQDRRYR